MTLTKERQLRKQEEIRNEILTAARNIISTEGVQGLSIRKLTKAIDYSPAIIYHYFKDKNEIVETLVGEGYQRILAAVKSVEKNEAEPEKEIREAFTKYIRAALEFPEEYKAFMLNESPEVLNRTRILEKGIAEKSPTMRFLYEAIQRGIDKGRFSPQDPELTAQVLWLASFGVIMRLIVEKDIGQDQIDRLIESYFDLVFKGIMLRG